TAEALQGVPVHGLKVLDADPGNRCFAHHKFALMDDAGRLILSTVARKSPSRKARHSTATDKPAAAEAEHSKQGFHDKRLNRHVDQLINDLVQGIGERFGSALAL